MANEALPSSNRGKAHCLRLRFNSNIWSALFDHGGRVISTFHSMAERGVPEEAAVNFDFKDIPLGDMEALKRMGRGDWREETLDRL